MLSCPYADSILWPAGFFCLQKLVAHFDQVLELLSARILSDIRIQLFQNTVVPLKLEVDVSRISSAASVCRIKVSHVTDEIGGASFFSGRCRVVKRGAARKNRRIVAP